MAQSLPADSSVVSYATVYPKQVYFTACNEELPIFNGRLHIPYSNKIEGVAYYETNDWRNGTVVYDKILYAGIMMKYDLVKDQLIITAPTKGVLYTLFSPRVDEFSFSGLTFVRLEKSGKLVAPGFYEVLANGKMTAYVKTVKTINETASSDALIRKIEQHTRYFVWKDNQYYEITNKKSLFRIVDKNKDEVLSFIRKQKLKFRKNKKQIITAAVTFYNQQKD